MGISYIASKHIYYKKICNKNYHFKILLKQKMSGFAYLMWETIKKN